MIIVFHFASMATGQSHAEVRKEIEKIIRYDTDLDYDKTPAFLVGILDGESSFVFDFVDEDYEHLPPRPHDIYELGSITKTFTSTLLAVLEDEGMIKMTDALNQHLDKKYQNPRLSKLTLEQLVTHQSGFPKLPMFFGKKQSEPNDPYANYSKRDLLLYYQQYIPENHKDGYIYSHVNFALLELAIESVTNLTYEDALRRYILEPLEMPSTFLDISEDRGSLLSPGYNRAEQITSPWTYGSFGASEGLKSSFEDLSKYLKMQLGLSHNELYLPLSKYHDVKIPTSYNKDIFIGHAWHIFQQGDYFDIYTHSGHTGGHHAFIAFIRETKTAVVVLSNSSLGTNDLGFSILRMINYNWKRKA